MTSAYIRTAVTLLATAAVSLQLSAATSPFAHTPMPVEASPSHAASLRLAPGTRVVDLDLSRQGPLVAVAIRRPLRPDTVGLWRIGTNHLNAIWQAPRGFRISAVTWHPAKQVLFIAGAQAGGSAILRLEPQIVAGSHGCAGSCWAARRIYRSAYAIRRLLAAPRPFFNEDAQRQYYRVFFAVRDQGRRYRTLSITTQGERMYQFAGPQSGMKKEASGITARSALPLAFFPAGDELLWQNSSGCVQAAVYATDHWEGSRPLRWAGTPLCGGSVTFTANGLGLIRWQPRSAGVDILERWGEKNRIEAAGELFRRAPSSTADGRGLVGVTGNTKRERLTYTPISMPLADVVNAWMFVQSAADMRHFKGDTGVFRETGDDQLYQLYDSELYQCGGLSQTLPTRPYMATSDAFWETFAAAYNGMFLVQERARAIPAFWRFVALANQYWQAKSPRGLWGMTFQTIAALHETATHNPEALRVIAARGVHTPPGGRKEIDYADFKPRGHYTANAALQGYFRAFRYLTAAGASAGPGQMRLLGSMPATASQAALQWVRAYGGFIAPSRAPLLWGNTMPVASYSAHPIKTPRIFPLSWGFDNEVLDSTVYHPQWPLAERIQGMDGPRLLPSGLDVAAALGSSTAVELLQPEIKKYPPLGYALQKLNQRWRRSPSAPDLYDRWMEALGESWAQAVRFSGVGRPPKIWKIKRLQTGLASWATLRHATLLVNERTGAECGEGGFEFLVMAPPRGYVEPDPKAFLSIAGLFDTAIQLENGQEHWDANHHGTAVRRANALRRDAGIARRLRNAAQQAREFARMASDELSGRPLRPADYDAILYYARVAEYNFKVFNSLANPGYALSTPVPMPKIADVSGGGQASLLYAAVGRPLEWDQIVPFFGQHEIVKGSVYSYYEFSRPAREVLSDAEWLKLVDREAHPAWVAPFIERETLSCPAQLPF